MSDNRLVACCDSSPGGTGGPAPVNINDLTDVNIQSPIAPCSTLVFDGAMWTNEPLHWDADQNTGVDVCSLDRVRIFAASATTTRAEFGGSDAFVRIPVTGNRQAWTHYDNDLTVTPAPGLAGTLGYASGMTGATISPHTVAGFRAQGVPTGLTLETYQWAAQSGVTWPTGRHAGAGGGLRSGNATGFVWSRQGTNESLFAVRPGQMDSFVQNKYVYRLRMDDATYFFTANGVVPGQLLVEGDGAFGIGIGISNNVHVWTLLTSLTGSLQFINGLTDQVVDIEMDCNAYALRVMSNSGGKNQGTDYEVVVSNAADWVNTPPTRFRGQDAAGHDGWRGRIERSMAEVRAAAGLPSAIPL